MNDRIHLRPLCTALADFYALLARAFAQPGDGYLAAMRDSLVADLNELRPAIPWLSGQSIADFRQALDAVADDLQLLQMYSRLFIVPPRPVSINAGLYLDSSVMGRSVDALSETYRQAGFQRADSVRDLDDHLSLILEFAALARERAAEDETNQSFAERFEAHFLRPWLPSFARELNESCEHLAFAPVYAHLAAMLRDVVWAGENPLGETPDAAADAPPEAAVAQDHCRHCGKPFIASEEMRNMKASLKEKGLDAMFMDVCPDCRTAEMGFKTLTPPEPPKYRWGLDKL